MSTQTPWIKAQASGGGGQCVEMRRSGPSVEVRDTKARGTGPTLQFAPGGFSAWVEAAKSGELDGLSS
jgi:hypothetical protein